MEMIAKPAPRACCLVVMALACFSLAAADQVPKVTFGSSGHFVVKTSGYEFVYENGRWQCAAAAGQPAIRDASSVLLLDENAISPGGPPRTRPSVAHGRLAGEKITEVVLAFPATAGKPLISLVFKFAERFMAVGMTVENVTSQPLKITAMDVVRSEQVTGLGRMRALTNGKQSWDECTLVDLKDGTVVESWWNLALRGYDGDRNLFLGFLDFDQSLSQITLRPAPDGGGKLGARAWFDRAQLPPGAALKSPLLIVEFPREILQGLEEYAERIAKQYGIKLAKPVPAGWCSWYYYYGKDGAQDELENLDLLDRLLRPYGAEYLVIDAGWQLAGRIAGGPWLPNDRFPGGMQSLVERIHQRGLKAGLWMRPFSLSLKSSLPKEHPQWCATVPRQPPERSPGGGFVISGFGGNVLDATNPGALGFLRSDVKRIMHDWGFDYLKIDFVIEETMADRYSDGRATKAMAFRNGVSAIREAMGPEKFLLGCGAPLGSSVGLVDGMRIGNDVEARRDWRGLMVGMRAAAARYHLHGKVWWNDADCLLVRPPLTLDQARLWASTVALTGGLVLDSDRLVELDAERLDIIRKVMPASGVSARPVDLFEHLPAELWLHKVEPQPDWWVIGIFNYSESATSRSIDLRRLGLPRQVVAADIWTQAQFTSSDGYLRVSLKPTSCLMLSVRALPGHPQVVFTSRHVIQASADGIESKWDSARKQLFGSCRLVGGDDYAMGIYLPPGFERTEVSSSPQVDLKEEKKGDLLLVRLRSPESRRIQWTVKAREAKRRQAGGDVESTLRAGGGAGKLFDD